jgi:hypothetical protein
MNIFNVVQGKMVQKNDKWNISKQKGEEIAHKYIIEILHDFNNKTSLSNLIILLNQRTKHIKFSNHSKRKPLSVYLRSIYGSMTKFLDSYSIYGILKHGHDIYVTLLEQNSGNHPDICSPLLHETNDWIIIKEDDFIMV